jgi:outer membrane protein assembly factor BamB
MAGELWAYDIASGQPKWDQPFEASGAIADLALIDEDRLFVPSLDNKVYLVETATGAQLGDAFVADDWIWTRPAFANGVAYFGDFSGKVYALDISGDGPVPADGWAAPYDTGTRIKAAPVVIGDTLVIATRDPEIHFVDITNARPLNRVPIEGAGTVRAGLLEYDGMAIIATTKGRLFLADPEAWRVVPLEVAGAQ